ncbi:MAG TPA: MmgE/PrpD family protein [Burkholderiales bacterium]|nr:MmgE/PrpD family protein [Burkholderiales bacterium]
MSTVMSKESTQARLESRGEQLSTYIADASARTFPPAVMDAALRALVDYIGVAVGASDDAPVRPVRRTVASWNAAGKSTIFMGGRTTPALAALANGTMAHAMDYDDTHPGGAGHPSAPCWSTALALAEEHELDEHDAIAAFITGFEIMARLGGGGPPGVGRSLQRRGFHPTSVFGRTGATAVACAALRLDAQQIKYALGIAATTAGGLVGSFGTHSKPFHAGKAAMDGILAAQLASNGFISATQLYELEKGLLDAFIQNREVEVPPLDFAARWELLGNGFKPFASCRATHASTQAARSLAARVAGKKIAKVHAKVHPNALVTAGKVSPRTPLEGKFSVPFCIALGLRGYRVVASDFRDEAMRDDSVMDVLRVVQLEAVHGQAPHSAFLDITLENGEQLRAQTDIVVGHPDNPMSWDDLRVKFEGLVEPVIGVAKTAELYAAARNFGQPGSLQALMALLHRPGV